MIVDHFKNSKVLNKFLLIQDFNIHQIIYKLGNIVLTHMQKSHCYKHHIFLKLQKSSCLLIYRASESKIFVLDISNSTLATETNSTVKIFHNS